MEQITKIKSGSIELQIIHENGATGKTFLDVLELASFLKEQKEVAEFFKYVKKEPNQEVKQLLKTLITEINNQVGVSNKLNSAKVEAVEYLRKNF